MYPNNQNNPSPPVSNSSPATPENSNPYSFITDNSNQPARKLPLPNGKASKFILLGVVVVLLIVIISVFIKILSSDDKNRSQSYVELAKKQTEIIRLSGLADTKAKNFDTKAYALTTKLALETSQKELMGRLEKRGIKGKDLSKQLSSSRNKESDQLLASAEKSGRYDETLLNLINKNLEDYQIEVKSSSNGSAGNDFKVLEKAYKQVSVLQATSN